jgi:glutamyl-tRNA reductase
MHLLAIGLSHKTAPVELREQLSFSSATVCAFLNENKKTISINAPTLADESVVLSTCNRLEYYTLAKNPQAATRVVIKLMSQFSQLPIAAFETHLYQRQDETAINHLMRVAAGLDSMVLGESQILGQLVQAYQSAQTHSTVGPILSRLFEKAIHAGKRARTETNIGLNPASISSIAIQLAQHHLGNLANQTVMILGAGEMGHLTIKALVKHGIKELLVVNRTKERADQLAAQWAATPLTFDQIDAGLLQADLLVTSTAAPHAVIHYHQIAQIMQQRPHRPLLIIDIALPRDVETTVEQIPNVHLYNIDSLQGQLEDNLKAREHEIPKVESIIEQETADFLQWYYSLNVVPTITSFREQVDSIRREELERTLNRLSNLSQEEQEIIVELSNRLMNKFLHTPTTQLRTAAANGNGIEYVTALHELFALEVD